MSNQRVFKPKEMKTRLILSCLFLIGFSLNLSAQKEKIGKALQSFLRTEFMVKFQDLKTEAENLALGFKDNQSEYNPKDVRRVATAYDKTARRFNQLLEQIKSDFLDRKKLKYISQYPDSYSKGLKADLQELNTFYSREFQQVVADVTDDEVDGSVLFALLFELAKLTSGAVSEVIKIRKESRIYNEEYLQRHLVKPNKIRYWKELRSLSYDSYDDYDEYSEDEYSDEYENDDYSDDDWDDEDDYGDDDDDDWGDDDDYGDDYSNPANNNKRSKNQIDISSWENPFGGAKVDSTKLDSTKVDTFNYFKQSKTPTKKESPFEKKSTKKSTSKTKTKKSGGNY